VYELAPSHTYNIKNDEEEAEHEGHKEKGKRKEKMENYSLR
jgi:hypothetical protein